MMLTQDARDLESHSVKLWRAAVRLPKRNTNLASEIREKDARATVKSARL